MHSSQLRDCFRLVHFTNTRLSRIPIRRQMSSPTTGKRTSIPHTVRTAAEPRQNRLFTVQLSHVEEVNPTVRLLQLTIPPNVQDPELQPEVEESEEGSTQPQPLTFFPGQWLDVHIPSVSTAGGFSITSTPADAQVLHTPELPDELAASVDDVGVPSLNYRGREPYVELAVQKAPSNPASAWLWRPKNEILGKNLSIRVGGSFVWPPRGVNLEEIRNVLFVAGGVGINPLISMLSHLNNNDESTLPFHHPSLNIHFLYSTKLPPAETPQASLNQVLFLSRLREIVRSQSQFHRLRITLELFLTNLDNKDNHPLTTQPHGDMTIHPRRIEIRDLRRTISGTDVPFTPNETVCYVCGPPKMTDETVSVLEKELNGRRDRVFFEKWW